MLGKCCHQGCWRRTVSAPIGLQTEVREWLQWSGLSVQRSVSFIRCNWGRTRLIDHIREVSRESSIYYKEQNRTDWLNWQVHYGQRIALSHAFASEIGLPQRRVLLLNEHGPPETIFEDLLAACCAEWNELPGVFWRTTIGLIANTANTVLENINCQLMLTDL